MSCSLPTRDQRADLEESLNTYSATPSAFDDDEADLLSVVCSHAGTLLAVLSRSLAAEQTAESLREAIATRDVIGQAKGILMERHHITEDAAFDILRVTSQRLNRKLRDVAAELTFAGELPLADSADAVGSPES
jgi:hypothetical protein